MTNKEKAAIIAKKFKQAVESKYEIIEMKLFGSFARGDYSKTSDMNFMIRLPKVDRNIEEDLFNMVYDLELENDCVIEVMAIPQNVSNIMIYQNIKKDYIAV
jgi:predicted nucleotidyltransferase